MPQAESRITRKILQALRAKGGLWIKISGSPMQTTGILDIIGCYQGRFVALEVKQPKSRDKLTERQRLNIQRVKGAAGIAEVVTDPEEALAILEMIDANTLRPV